MSDNKFTFSGLDELRAALRNLPEELTGEAGHIVEAATAGAEATIKADYPVRTGKLRDSMTSSVETFGFAVVGTVKNTDPIANIFEHGTQARHDAIGATRGSMPPGHVFVPVVMRKRQQMYEQLKDLLTRHGLLVSGEA